MNTSSKPTRMPIAAQLSVVDGTDTIPVQLDPAWDRARELLATGRKLAIELADEIERLRKAYLQDKTTNLRKGNSPTLQTVTSGNPSFSTMLQEQLGLQRVQAARILESAEYQRKMLSLAAAKEGSQIDIGAEKPFLVTSEAKTKAEQAISEWGAPIPPKPSRQWAGIMGGAATAGKERAPANPAKVLDRAMRSLGNSLESWWDLSTSERAELETMWSMMLEAKVIPASWVTAAVQAAGGRKA